MPTTPTPPFPGFITTEQAAAKRGLSVRTAINRGDLGISLKKGRRRWLYEAGLDALDVNDTGGWAAACRHVETLDTGS